MGWELRRVLGGLGEVISPDREELDLSRPEGIGPRVREIRPGLIINAAAYTAVDRAEEEPGLAMAVNGEAPGILAEEAKKIGASLIHYSTDYVFDGENKTTPYREDDPPNPQNVYGETKLAGERAVQEAGGAYLILRTGWVYSLRRKNFLRTIQRLAGEREELKIVNDQFGSPTWSRTIAEATRTLLDRTVKAGPDHPAVFPAEAVGIYHLTCAGQTTWYDFTRAILDCPDSGHRPRVIPIPTSEFPTPATRPRYSVLSNEKIKRVFGIEPPSWEEALKRCLRDVS